MEPIAFVPLEPNPQLEAMMKDMEEFRERMFNSVGIPEEYFFPDDQSFAE